MQLQFSRFFALAAFASSSSSRAVRARQLVVQGAGPARFVQQACQRLSQNLYDTFVLRPYKLSISGNVKPANFNGTRSNFRCHRLLPKHVLVYHSHRWVATRMADQYFEGNFEKERCRVPHGRSVKTSGVMVVASELGNLRMTPAQVKCHLTA